MPFTEVGGKKEVAACQEDAAFISLVYFCFSLLNFSGSIVNLCYFFALTFTF